MNDIKKPADGGILTRVTGGFKKAYHICFCDSEGNMKPVKVIISAVVIAGIVMNPGIIGFLFSSIITILLAYFLIRMAIPQAWIQALTNEVSKNMPKPVHEEAPAQKA